MVNGLWVTVKFTYQILCEEKFNKGKYLKACAVQGTGTEKNNNDVAVSKLIGETKHKTEQLWHEAKVVSAIRATGQQEGGINDRKPNEINHLNWI